MSVITPADEKLDGASHHLDTTIQLVSSVVVDRCSGADEYTPENMAKLRRVLNTLLEVREELR